MDTSFDTAALDLEAILAPISAEAPTGPDLRLDYADGAPYRQLKDARQAARAAERRQEAESDASAIPSEWRTIADLAPSVLATQSKDLEVAAWLAEALLRTRGMAGLADGFAVLRGLVERFWPDLHPHPDEDGVETTVAPLAGLNGRDGNGTLLQPLSRVPLTFGADGGSYALWQVEQAAGLDLLGDDDRRERRIAAGTVPMDVIEASARTTPPAAFVRLASNIDRCLREFQGLEAALDARLGVDGPPTRAIRDTLEQMRRTLTGFAGSALDPAAAASPQGDAGSSVGPAASAMAAFAGSVNAAAPPWAGSSQPMTIEGFASREDALRTLEAVARYFREAEPHSPVSYTLTELVRRARLPFVELLAELLPDEDARRGLLTAAGIDKRLAESRED
ncbi:type VI secretion system protein TssA [Azospirillum rugosum]|uniref:Type VI secretion system protein ImpA n=1 Tax=Azospirillum rugosum TaxID=416170 RepID=A0ABS4SKX0_9PROT|nr:type VI secretion system protein TssA [Azospirillum rugosum]MBP2293207.1 type VI secretion system protein ImpA [Azospirillum rugosum]